MARRNALPWLFTLVTLLFVSRTARAAGDVVCGLSEIGSIAVGAVSMAIDFGFTANAIAHGMDTPNHPGSEVAKAQIGLMAPQAVVTGIGVLFNSLVCPSYKAAIITEAIPLAWSIALLGHGVWSLRSANAETEAALKQPGPIVAGARVRLFPSALAQGAVGLRMQGRF